MGQFSMEKPALKGQFSVEINIVPSLAEIGSASRPRLTPVGEKPAFHAFKVSGDIPKGSREA